MAHEKLLITGDGARLCNGAVLSLGIRSAAATSRAPPSLSIHENFLTFGHLLARIFRRAYIVATPLRTSARL
jgi:hypothetical protein